MSPKGWPPLPDLQAVAISPTAKPDLAGTRRYPFMTPPGTPCANNHLDRRHNDSARSVICALPYVIASLPSRLDLPTERFDRPDFREPTRLLSPNPMNRPSGDSAQSLTTELSSLSQSYCL